MATDFRKAIDVKKNQSILIFKTKNLRSRLYKSALKSYSEEEDIVNELQFYNVVIVSVIDNISRPHMIFIDLNGCESEIDIKTKPSSFIEFLRTSMKIKKNKQYIEKIPSFYETKEYGYKDEKVARQSLVKLKKKPINEQLQIIEILVRRALRHPNRTTNMLKAVSLYSAYKKQLGSNVSFPLMTKKLVDYFMPLAEHYQIGLIARGVVESSITDKLFLDIYPKTENDLKEININQNSNTSWYLFRKRILFKKMKTMRQWFHTSGKLNGLPTKEHIVFILWGYSPHVDKLKQIQRRKLIEKIKS